MHETIHIEDLCLLAGIAPPDIRRDVCARMEKTKLETNEAHSLYGQDHAEGRLNHRNCFLRSVNLLDSLLMSYGVMKCLGDYKKHPTKLPST